MTNIRRVFTNQLMAFLIVIILVVTVAVAFGYQISRKEKGPQALSMERSEDKNSKMNRGFSKVILSVRDMSCSGCIATIKGSLSDIDGLGDILVDVSGGRADVYFDPDILKDTNRIEKAITESGYPAKIQKVVSFEDIMVEMDIAAEKSKLYIASVGGYEIARTEFDTELTAGKKKYEKLYGDDVFTSAKGDTLMGQLKAQVVSKLIEEGTLMHAISLAGYEVSRDRVETELKKFYEASGKSAETFQRSLDDAGYSHEYFIRKFETSVLINSYIEEKVLEGASDQSDKQNLFNSWFNNSKLLAEVIYYDKDLENLIKNQGASGSCCSVQ